jgi:golgin subfamily B member 1
MGLEELRDALETNPNDTRSFQTHLEPVLREGTLEDFDAFLETVQESVQDDDSLANLLRAADFKAKSVGGDTAVHVTFRVGSAFRERLSNDDMAEMYFRRLPADSDYAIGLQDFYVNFYIGKENWRKLEQLFQKQAELTGEPNPGQEAKRRTARLAQERGNQDRALAYWQSLRKELPADPEVQSNLIDLYEATGKWHQVADILRSRADSLPAAEVDEKVALYNRLIPLYTEKLNMEAKVASTYQAILALQPSNEDAFTALCDHYRSTNRFPDLVKVLKASIAAADEPQRRYDLHFEIAVIMEENFSNATEAMKNYEAMLEIAPEDLSVVRKLKELYEQRRDWNSYVDVARRELGFLEGDERFEQLRKLAQLAFENVRDPAAGVELWKEVRETEPQDSAAFDALMQLYERSKQFEGVAELLEERIEQVDQSEQAPLLERLATIYAARIGDMDLAALTWGRLLELDNENHRAKAELKKILVRSKDLEALDSFFRTYGNLNEYQRALDLMAKDEEEAVLKAQVLFRLAALYIESGGRESKARSALENVLSVDPHNVDAAEQLVTLYGSLGQWEELVQVQDLLLVEKADMSAAERLDLLLSKADTHESKLQEVEEAFFTYVSAYQIDWTRTDVYQEMERLADASANWETFISVLEQAFEMMHDETEQVPYLHRIAEIWELHLEDLDNAAAYYHRVLGIDSSHQAALGSLTGLYEKMGNYTELRAILELRLEIERDAEPRRTLLVQLGSVCLEKVNDPEGAVNALQTLLNEFPDYAVAYDHLSSVLLSEGRHDDLLQLQEMRLTALELENPDIADTLVDIAELYYSIHDDIPVTVERTIEALRMVSDHPRAVALLEELISVEDVQSRIALALEPVYQERGALFRLADVLEIQLRWAEDYDQEQLLRRLLEIYTTLENAASASTAVQRLLKLVPEDAELKERLETLAEELDDWFPVVALYGELVADISNESYRHEVMRAAATIYHLRIGDAELAKQLYGAVLEERPDDGESLAALQGIAFEEEDWQGLLAIYEARKEMEQDADGRISVMFDIALLCKDHLEDLERASSTVEEIIDLDPANVEALRLLDVLYTQRERWDDLLRALDQTCSLTAQTEVQVELLLRMAELYERRLDDLPGMVARLEHVLQLDNSNAAAVEMLERNIDGEIAIPVIDLLDAYMRRVEAWDRLIDLLYLRKSFVDDAVEQLTLQKEIGRLYEEEVGNAQSAFENYRIALALSPEDEDVLTALLLLSENLGNFEELFLILDEEAKAMDESPQQVQMWRIQATMARDKLDDSATAIDYFSKVMARDEEDAETITALASLYRDAEQWEPLVGVLERNAELVGDIDEKKMLFLEMGSIYFGSLENPEKAIVAYEEILSLDPNDITALNSLDNLYELTERWEEYEQVLQGRARIVDDADEQRFLLLRRAEVLEVHLDRLDEANEVLGDLYNRNSQDMEVVGRLEQVHDKREDWFSLLDILRHKLTLLGEDEHYLVQMKIAATHATQMLDIHQAVETYRAVIEQFPQEEGPIDELEALVLAGEEKDQPFALLKPLLAERGQWERLLVCMEAYKGAMDDPGRKLDLVVEMSAIAEERLEDLERSFYLAAEAVQTAPHRTDVIDRFEQIGQRAGLLEQVVSVYAATADEAESTEDVMNLMRRKAELLKNELADYERAVEEYEKLRELEQDRFVLEALDELYSVLERWEKLAEVLRDEIDIASDIEEKLLYYYRLADSVEENLGDANRAMDVLKEAYLLNTDKMETLLRLRRLFDEKVGDPEAADLLEAYYSSHEDWEEVAAILKRRFELAEGRDDRLENAQKLVNVLLSRLEDKARAIVYCGEALVIDPEDFASLDQLLRLKDDTGMLSETVEYLQRARRAADDVEAYRNLGMHAGGMLRELERHEDAEQCFRELLDKDEEFIAAWQALEALYQEQGRVDDHERTLAHLISLQEYEDDRIPLLLKLGRLRRDQMEQGDGAIEAFQQIVDIDERNEEALNSLASLYEDRGQWQELTAILENMAELAGEPEERVALLSRLADINEEKLGNVEAAVQNWQDVLDWSPSTPHVLANLQRLYRQQGEWQSFVEMAEREANLDNSDDHRKVELWRQIAGAAYEQLEDSLLAQQNWDRVAAVLPADEEAVVALRGLYRLNEDFMKLAALLERIATDEEVEEGVRLQAWTELGQVKMDETMDIDGAILSWTEVLTIESGNLAAYDALERLYLESARFEEATRLLLEKLELVTEEEGQVELLDKVATLYEESLNRWQDAAELRERIITIAPASFDQYERVANLYEANEKFEELTALLENRLQVEDEVEDQVKTLGWLAELYEERLGNDKSALDAVKLALALKPGNLDLTDAGERLAERSELWQDLYEVWSAAVPHVDETRQIDYMVKLGGLLRDRLENYPEAVEWYERVVELDGDAEAAHVALVDLYELTEEWEKLAGTLEQLAEVTANFETQVQYSLRLGDTYFQKLEDYAKAQNAYQQVLELDPTEERAVDALQALYGESGEWEKLIEILAVRASIHPEEDGALKLISGELLETRLENPMGAAEIYEELVTYDPSATEAFERLERIYTEAEVWDRLVETYERILSYTMDEDARIELLRKLALLNETAVGNGEAAADYYQQILDVRPEEVEVITSLERLYEENDRWDDLVLVLRRTVQLAESVRDKVAYLDKIASLYVEKLDDIHSAIMAYKEILEHDPAHLETLMRLEVLFSEEGDWMEVLNVLDLRLQISSDVDEIVAFYLRKGKILVEELLMPDKAREQFHLALERAPLHEEATARLLALYEEDEDWERIVETLLSQAKSVSSEEDRAMLFARMGMVMKEKMEDEERAIEVFEAALERVPHLHEALSPLAEIYMQRGQWEKAFPLLEMLKQLIEDESDTSVQADLYRKLAKASLAVGHKDEALDYYRRAYDRNPEDLDTLEGLAALNYEQGNFDVSQAYYRNLLEKAEENFDAEKLVSIYRSMGEVEMKQGNPESAREYLGKVLDLQPNDLGCLSDLVGLMEDHEDWEGAIRYRRQLVSLLVDPLEQWKMLIAIGDTYREKLDNLELAIRAYNEALEAQPYSKSALVKLLEIHINAKAFAEAINILQHLVQVEDSPLKKAAYTFTIATVYRQELGEPDMAADYYEQTLDLNPEKLEAFRGVDELLTEARNWDELEGAYRRMVGRVRGKGLDKVEFMLYRGLGEIYRSRLQRPDLAISSFELAAKLNREDVKTHEILAQLYVLQDRMANAVTMHRVLVSLEPERLDSYRQMAVLQRALGADDDAWFSLAVLAMAGKLNGEEKTFFASKQPPGLLTPQRSLDADIWLKLLFSKVENIQVGEIFRTIYQAIGAYLEGRDPKDLGLRKKDEVDFKQKTVFTTVFNRVSQLTGIPVPKVYLSDRAFGMRIEATIPPVLVIGKDMLHGKTEKELAFVIAKHLTYFHPMHLLAAAYPAPVLKLLYQVAVRFAHPDAEVEGADSDQFQVLSQHLRKRISPQLGTTLTAAVDQFYRRQRGPGINKWLTGVELTANHAGLLACLDLAVSAGVLKQESIAFSKLPPREKAKELVLFAVSEEFSELRKHLSLDLP